MFLEAQEFLLKQPRLGGVALSAPDSLNKFVFLEPDGEWLGWGISRPPIKPAAGLGQVPSFPPAACPVPWGDYQPWAKVRGLWEGANSSALCLASRVEFHWQ